MVVSMLVSAGGVLVSLVGVVSSAFLPQPIAASAMVRARRATIARAKIFRIVFSSPPLGLAAPELPVAALVLSALKTQKHHSWAVSWSAASLLSRFRRCVNAGEFWAFLFWQAGSSNRNARK